MTHLKIIGEEALVKSIETQQKKTCTVRLKTFHTQNHGKASTSKSVTPGKSDEVTALLRMTQIMASGGRVDVVKYIGHHECSKVPPSLFDEHGFMRSTGAKSSLVKAIKEEANIESVTELTTGDGNTAVVVDAMYFIHRLSFQKDERFSAIADRYRHYLLPDVPRGTQIIHFCCDRYKIPSMKGDERLHRSGKSRSQKVYEVVTNSELRIQQPSLQCLQTKLHF